MSFKNALNLLKHAQFTHKLEIFEDKELDLCPTTNYSSKTSSSPVKQHFPASSSSQFTTSLNGTQAKTSPSSRPLTNNTNTSNTNGTSNSGLSNKKEIFIDVIPSNSASSCFSNRNQSYNITVTSSSSNSSGNKSTSSASNFLFTSPIKTEKVTPLGEEFSLSKSANQNDPHENTSSSSSMSSSSSSSSSFDLPAMHRNSSAFNHLGDDDDEEDYDENVEQRTSSESKNPPQNAGMTTYKKK